MASIGKDAVLKFLRNRSGIDSVTAAKLLKAFKRIELVVDNLDLYILDVGKTAMIAKAGGGERRRRAASGERRAAAASGERRAAAASGGGERRRRATLRRHEGEI